MIYFYYWCRKLENHLNFHWNSWTTYLSNIYSSFKLSSAYESNLLQLVNPFLEDRFWWDCTGLGDYRKACHEWSLLIGRLWCFYLLVLVCRLDRDRPPYVPSRSHRIRRILAFRILGLVACLFLLVARKLILISGTLLWKHAQLCRVCSKSDKYNRLYYLAWQQSAFVSDMCWTIFVIINIGFEVQEFVRFTMGMLWNSNRGSPRQRGASFFPVGSSKFRCR